jgi:cytochrome P450
MHIKTILDSFYSLVTRNSYTIPLILLSIPIFILLHDYSLYLRMPPGPRPLPFIGNKLSIPKSSPWIKFEQWSKIYGPMFTIWIGRRPTLVISDPNVAVDLLEKRSNKYSSRPRFVTMGEIYWDQATILVQPYGKKWLIRRKLLHSALTPSALRLYKPIQDAEATRLCNQLLASPSQWEGLLDRYTSSIVFSVSYGHRIDSLDSKTIRQRLDFMQYAASLNVPGAYLVESLPVLKYLPNILAPWKAEIQRHGREEAAVNMSLVADVQSDLATAKDPTSVPDSLCKLLLLSRDSDPAQFSLLSDRDFSYIPASLFGAGSDTTASTLCSAFLALITHPRVLKAAQKELDTIIGPSRTPTFADEPSLPYIRALCKEVLRWRPVAVLGGTPHASTASDTYNGYYIPSDATILCNSWAINLNPEYYPNPHHVNPLRFLSDSDVPTYNTSNADVEKGSPHPSKLGHSSFGWGRRICPGADLASNSLFIALAKLLWAFDILPIEGVKYDIFNYTEGFNIRPRKFECIIRVRSEAHRKVLVEEMVGAERTMSKFTLFKE